MRMRPLKASGVQPGERATRAGRAMEALQLPEEPAGANRKGIALLFHAASSYILCVCIICICVIYNSFHSYMTCVYHMYVHIYICYIVI